ncbi:hypothetical protein FQN54_004999 [Arachnomyces sp. PD_36]|nr:hypothetical protein FQN54_004999 [Arachnomyces sp. PD_36]
MAGSGSVPWTLLFKKNKVTILLLLSPSQTIASVKETLLKALKSREITEIAGEPVPESAAGIELGVPIDRNDLERGWQKLEVPAQGVKDGDKKRVAGGKDSILNTTLNGAHIKDAQSLAFRFREVTGDDKEDELEQQSDDPGWDVLIPTYDDEEGDNIDETT